MLFRQATIAAILMLAAVFLSSCGIENNYKDNQLSSVFPLRQLVQKTETSKTSGGSYLLFFASYHSQESNTDYIKMFAKVAGNYRLISVPIEKIRVNINDSLTTPTLQVRYNGLTENDEKICEGWYEKVFIISCPEKYLPKKLLPISL